MNKFESVFVAVCWLVICCLAFYWWLAWQETNELARETERMRQELKRSYDAEHSPRSVCPECGGTSCVQGPGIACSIAAGFGQDDEESKKCRELIDRVPSVKYIEARKFLSRNEWDIDKAIRDIVRTNMEKN